MVEDVVVGEGDGLIIFDQFSKKLSFSYSILVTKSRQISYLNYDSLFILIIRRLSFYFSIISFFIYIYIYIIYMYCYGMI